MIDELSPESATDAPRQRLSTQMPDAVKICSGSRLERAITNAGRAADEAWRLLDEAIIEGRASKIQVLLSIHNKAVDGLFRTETAYREELQQRKVLISLAEAMDMARRGYDVILQRLKVLPQNVASLCNPADPAQAIAALEAECTAIVSGAQELYASWSESKPV